MTVAFRCSLALARRLYKMVRNMMGLLIAVGDGSIEPAHVAELIAARDRSRLPKPAPAHGLTLEAVYYDQGWEGAYSHPLHPGEAKAEEAEVPEEHAEGGLRASPSTGRNANDRGAGGTC